MKFLNPKFWNFWIRWIFLFSEDNIIDGKRDIASYYYPLIGRGSTDHWALGPGQAADQAVHRSLDRTLCDLRRSRSRLSFWIDEIGKRRWHYSWLVWRSRIQWWHRSGLFSWRLSYFIRFSENFDASNFMTHRNFEFETLKTKSASS